MNTQFRSPILVLTSTFAVFANVTVFAQHHGVHVGAGGASAGHHSASSSVAPTHHFTGVVPRQLSTSGQLQPSGQSMISRNVMPTNNPQNSSNSFLSQHNSSTGLSSRLTTSSGLHSPNTNALHGVVNKPPSTLGLGHSTSTTNHQVDSLPKNIAHANQLSSNFAAKNLPPSGINRTNQSVVSLGAKNQPPHKVGQSLSASQVTGGVVPHSTNKPPFSSSKNVSLSELAKHYQSKQSNATTGIDSKSGLAKLGEVSKNGPKNGAQSQVSGSPKNSKYPVGSIPGGSGASGSGSGGSGSGGSGSGGGGMSSLQILSTFLIVPVGGIPFGGYGGYAGSYGGGYGSDCGVYGDPLTSVSTTLGAGGAPVVNGGLETVNSVPSNPGPAVANNNVFSSNPSPVAPVPVSLTESITNIGHVLLMLSESAGGAINFGIDGIEQTIAPGSVSKVALANETKGEIRFDNGVGNDCRYTLTAGETYEFYVRDGAWDLRQKIKTSPSAEGAIAKRQVTLMHFASDAPPVFFTVSGNATSIEPGATKSVDLASAETSEISFDNGTGTTKRYTLTAGQNYEFFAKDEAWDLREKSIQPTQTQDKPHLITGRFAVINPPENNISLSFKVNGEVRTVTAGNLQIVTSYDDEIPQVAVAGPDGHDTVVPVGAGKIYEFWDNRGVWDLREKILIASESTTDGEEDAKVSGI